MEVDGFVTPCPGPAEGASISAGEIHVWRAQLDSDGWPDADRLPADERQRAVRLRSRRLRKRWLAARWALRDVLGRYLDTDPATVELRVAKGGKPALATPGSPLRFNLSHSAGEALIAVAREREVGVDIEQIRPRGDLLALARRALEPGEAAAIAAMPAADRPAAFHVAWTRREAIAKCLGVGLAGPLPEDDVAVSDFDAGPGFAAAVAVTGRQALPLRRFEIEPGLSPSGAG
jgi:4'-phosphopantetheinyl transferase